MARWAAGCVGLVRAVGHGTVKAANIERVATGTQHFNREHVDLGMSPLTKRIALAQDLEGIVEKRRRNYFFLLGTAARTSPRRCSTSCLRA